MLLVDGWTRGVRAFQAGRSGDMDSRTLHWWCNADPSFYMAVPSLRVDPATVAVRTDGARYCAAVSDHACQITEG